MKVYAMLADGFEEVEAIAVIDLLRRDGVEVNTVSIMGRRAVTGAHQIRIEADQTFEQTDFTEGDMIFLPGGMPGTKHLQAHEGLAQQLKQYAEREDKWLAAICAAPSVLGSLGILKGKKATCYPGFEEKLDGAILMEEPVVADGQIFTSRGVGTALDLGLAIVEVWSGRDEAAELSRGIQYR